jgi:hypothetical protein
MYIGSASIAVDFRKTDSDDGVCMLSIAGFYECIDDS